MTKDTSDVVARLDEIVEGATGASWIQDAAREAAALISSLVAENERLREALLPFARLVEQFDTAAASYLRKSQGELASGMTDDFLAGLSAPDEQVALTSGELSKPVLLTWGDFRKARASIGGGNG